MSELGSSLYGSSVGGGDGLLPIPGEAKQLTLGDGEETEEMDLDEQQSLVRGAFGVIYTVSRERTVTWRFVAFKTFLDCWQLLMLTINPQYGWKIDPTTQWWPVISFIQLNGFMTARGLTFFLVCLYVFVVLLLFTLGLCVWVAWSFKSKRFDRVWPIAFLRWFGVIFFQMLDVASMSFFLITLDCQYFDVDPAVMYHNQEFPAVYCWSMPYMMNAAVAALSLLVFVSLTALFQMGEMELNQKTKNPLAMAHSMVEVHSFLLKFLMTAASTFLNNLRWLSTFYTVCTLLLLFLSLQRTPYYYGWMNCIRSGVNATVLWSAVMLMVMVFGPGIDLDDAEVQSAWHSTMTIVMLAGLIPAGLLGALAAHLRLRHFLITVVDRFRHAVPGTKSHFIHEFSHPLQVEVASRCCRKWVDKDTLNETEVALAGTILRAGMQQLPGSAYMATLYAAYLIEVQGSYQSGLLELKAAKKADPSFLELFAIFNLEQQNTQRASGAKGSKGADLVSYVEQQRDYRLAMKVHKESLQATSVFWRALIHPVIKLEGLANAVADFDRAVKEADSTYRSVILRHPENWKLIRIYAKFVEFIKNDPFGAAKWNAEADRLFQAEDDEKHNAVLSDALDGGDGSADEKNRAIRAAMEDCNRGVIIVNAQCTVTAVNKTTCDLLGYMKKALLGKNVNMLLPHPFAKAHDAYVANCVRMGNEAASQVLNRPAHLVMMHKDRSIIPITLIVSKISGVGMDSMFMGIFEHTPPPPDVACAWAMTNGVLLSVDATFSDWFGHQPRDLPPGTYMNSLVVDSKALTAAFKTAKGKDPAPENPTPGHGGGGGHLADAALLDPKKSFGLHMMGSTVRLSPIDFSSDNVRVEGLQLKHKYAGPIACSMGITNGGSGGNRHFFCLTFSRPAELRSIVVTDRRGKLCHVSRDLAADLGYPVSSLLGDMASSAWDVLLPEPFAQLHRSYVMSELPSGPPPFSCRSGLSMCLLTMTPNGPEPTLFAMQVKQRKGGEGGESCSIVDLDKCSMEKALDERRLTVLVDENGFVVDVGNSPEGLYGFDPVRMLGRCISAFVDVFKAEGEVVSGEVMDDLPDLSDAYVQETLVELAVRSLSAPGNSYRVGVTAPPEVQVSRLAGDAAGGKPRRASALDIAIAQHMAVQGVHPAVMQVKLHQGSTCLENGVLSGMSQGARPGEAYTHKPLGNPDALLKKGRTPTGTFSPAPPLGASAMGHVSGAGMRRRVSSNGRLTSEKDKHPPRLDDVASYLDSEAEDLIRAVPPETPAEPAVLSEIEEAAQQASSIRAGPVKQRSAKLLQAVPSLRTCGGLLLEVQLWKVELLSGLLQLDANSGRIVGTSDVPLHQPGPLLGLDASSLVGAHIGDVLPPMAMQYRPLSDLFLPELGAGPAQEVTAKKGGLKMDKKNQLSRDRKPGAVSVVATSHLVDGMELQLSVQAVHGWAQKKIIHVILHVHNPETGMPCFKDWLQANCAPRVLPSKVSPEQAAALSRGASGRNRASLEIVPTMGPGAALPNLGFQTPMITLNKRASMHAKISAPGDGGAGAAAIKAPATLNGGPKSGAVEGTDGQADCDYDDLDQALVALGHAASITAGTSPPTAVAQTRESRTPNRASVAIAMPADDDNPPSAAHSMMRVKEWVQSCANSPQASINKRDGADGERKPSRQLSPASLRAARGAEGEEGGDSGSEAGSGGGEERAKGAEVQEGEFADEALMVKDAEGALGHMRRSPSDKGSDLDEAIPGAEALSAHGSGDYKRGQRFKRIARMLTGDQAKTKLRRFRLMAWAAAAFVLIVTLACFVTMYTLLKQQEASVAVLNTVGRAGVETGQIYMSMVNCDMLIMNQYVKGLVGIESHADLQPECMEMAMTHAELFKELFSTAYYTIMAMPDQYGLHTIWNKPSINATEWDDTMDAGIVVESFQMKSLWDIGQQYAADARDMSQNIVAHNNTPGVTYWRTWSYPRYIEYNSDAIFDGIFDSLDGLVQIVIQNAASVNKVQYTLMAIEGIVCSTLATCFIFFIVTKMTMQRWNLYNVFMVIPVTLLKGLAKKTAAFEDLGPVDAEGVASGEAEGGGGGGAQPAASGNAGGAGGGAKMTFGSGNQTLRHPSGAVAGVLSSLAFWRKRAAVSPTNSNNSNRNKRKLVSSHGPALYLCAPFIAYGVIMMAINASGHAKLAQVSGPIALFNLVNFVTTEYYRSVALAEDLIQTYVGTPANLDRIRNRLISSNLEMDYQAMLYGASAVPNSTNPRYTLATTGVAFTPQGEDIMYNTKACLRTNQSSCLAANHSLYPDTTNGLDTLMQLYLRTVANIITINDTVLVVPCMGIWQFATVWTTRDDIEGGLDILNADFYNYVISVYSGVLTIHIVGLVLSILLMVVFLFFMLRPYVNRLSNETKRIAELLSQLPTDVDVESLVRRAQADTKADAANETGPRGSGTGAKEAVASDKFSFSENDGLLKLKGA